MTTQDFLKDIDNDAYALKVRLIADFDQKFGTRLARRGVDNVHFADILHAVRNMPSERIYPFVKRIVGHGVTEEQKDFLYSYLHPPFSNDAYKDFDSFADRIKISDPRVVGIFVIINDEYGRAAIKISYHPFTIVQFFREMPMDFEPVEAILVQNDYALIISTVCLLDILPEYEKARKKRK